MIISCVKWGDKFSHEHVNRLYKMVCKNMKDDFTFVCYTENPDNLHPDIKTISLDLNLDLENWWWKLTLFQYKTDKVNIFFDLDVVIQNDITHLKDLCMEDMLYMIKAYWKPYPLTEFDTNLNSSVMIWKGDLTDLWIKFEKDHDYYMLKYNGIDSYLDHDQHDKLLYIPEGEVYSRLYGIDENNYWKAGDNIEPNYFFEHNYNICIFNGWRRKTDKIRNSFLLDDEGYDGFEKYY